MSDAFFPFTPVCLPTKKGLALDLDVEVIAAVSSTSFFCGACLFPVSGWIMDRFGRKCNASLCVVTMACSLLFHHIYNLVYTLHDHGMATKAMAATLNAAEKRPNIKRRYLDWHNIDNIDSEF